MSATATTSADAVAAGICPRQSFAAVAFLGDDSTQKKPVRLHIETGGSMAGCIEDLFTQYLRDFDRFKGLNCSPTEQRFQDVAHRIPRCCFCNIKVLRAQHRNAMPALR